MSEKSLQCNCIRCGNIYFFSGRFEKFKEDPLLQICPLCEILQEKIDSGEAEQNRKSNIEYQNIQELLTVVFQNSYGLNFEIILSTLLYIKETHPEVDIEQALNIGFNEWIK